MQRTHVSQSPPTIRRFIRAAPERQSVRIDATASDEARATGLHEVLVVWVMLGMLAVSILATYAHVPLASLYHVSRTGIAGGASRALVALNFPIAFIAIAVIGVTVARLFAVPDALSRRERITVGSLAAVATTLCLVAGFPGVVKQSDLDARPINVLPAIGVGIALALTVVAIRRTGLGVASRWTGGDALSILIAVAIVVLGLPWILADLGVYVADIPGIGGWFMSQERVTGSGMAAVHLGHHHGADGIAFALSALLLSRNLGALRTSRLRYPLTVYVALMFVYGLANATQDFWGEQLVKRGTTDSHFPSVLLPALTPAWGMMFAAVGLVTLGLLRANSLTFRKGYEEAGIRQAL
jgi:hypothetical protein